jgi:hypothetical protein
VVVVEERFLASRGLWSGDQRRLKSSTSAQWGWEGEGKTRKPKLLLNTFIDHLKSIGMIGYETWHADFLEIQPPLGI